MDLANELKDLSIEEAAKLLLGQQVVRSVEDHRLTGRIVEAEGYHQSDPASHTFNGPTPRNRTMFGPAGHAYVYFTYGMHYCFNVTAGREGEGAGILIRALEPLDGLESMRENRGLGGQYELCSGPAKLTQALRIDRELDGHDLRQPPLQLVMDRPRLEEKDIVSTKRIGISKATDKQWRFYIKDNPFISKP